MIVEILWKEWDAEEHDNLRSYLEVNAEKSWDAADPEAGRSVFAWDHDVTLVSYSEQMVKYVAASGWVPKDEWKPDYDSYISAAAIDYQAARSEHSLDRTEETRVSQSVAYEKLAWMIAARSHGWNPMTYVPED